MRTIPYSALILLLTVLLLSGCGPKQPALTLAVGGAPNELAFWESLVGDFEKASGIPVGIIRQPTDSDQRRQGVLIPLKARKHDPDVFLMDIAWISQFASSGWLLSLAGSGGKPDTGVFYRNMIEMADTYESKLVALPVYADIGLLYYRKDLLAEYGLAPPATWDDLVKASIKVQEAERRINPNFYGFVWQGAQYEGLICNFLEYAVSAGGGIRINPAGLYVNTPENLTAVEFMAALVHRHAVSPPNTFTEMKEEEVRAFFQNGNALFERNWPYAWKLHQAEDSPVRGKVGIAALPVFPGGRSASTLGGWHVGISRFSDVPDQARALVDFIVSYDTQKRLAMELGWNPGRRDVYRDPEILGKMPHFRQLGTIFNNAYPRPNVPYYTQISEILQRYIHSVISGKMKAREALAGAEKEAGIVVQRYTGGQN